MKKFIGILLAIVMLISMSGCGQKVPYGFTNETYSLGNEALKVMDSFLGGEMDIDEAEEELSRIYDGLKADVVEPDPNSKNYEEELIQAFSNSGISFSVTSFVMGMYGWENEYGNTYDCQEIRDELYEQLNTSLK